MVWLFWNSGIFFAQNLVFFFFFSSRIRHTRSSTVSWARRCVYETEQSHPCPGRAPLAQHRRPRRRPPRRQGGCPLYTTDAADEEDSVHLGGRRIIKKKKKKKDLIKNKKVRNKITTN